jgi:hypothetical protein
VDTTTVVISMARCKGLVRQLSRGSERDTHLYPRQGRVASLGDVPWRMQVSVGACPSFGKVEAAIQNCNHAGSLDGTKSGLAREMGMER